MQAPLACQERSGDDGGPVFAVIIPTYNQADLLREALVSVLTQTFRRIEVAVVDNFSTDHTLEVIRSFKDSRLSLFQVHNEGIIAVSRNLGIRETQARLLAFLDSDDIWYPEKLEQVYRAWTEHAEIGLVSHDQYAMRRGRVAYRIRCRPDQEDMHRFLLLNGNRLATSATVVDRACLDRVGGFSEDPNLAGVEDYDLWLRLSQVCRFYFLHRFLGEFHLHPKSHTASSGVHLAHVLYLLDMHFQMVGAQGAPLPRGLLRRGRAAFYARAARGASSWWGEESCLAYCCAALKESPISWKTYAIIARSLAARLLGKASRMSRLNGRSPAN